MHERSAITQPKVNRWLRMVLYGENCVAYDEVDLKPLAVQSASGHAVIKVAERQTHVQQGLGS